MAVLNHWWHLSLLVSLKALPARPVTVMKGRPPLNVGSHKNHSLGSESSNKAFSKLKWPLVVVGVGQPRPGLVTDATIANCVDSANVVNRFRHD